MRCEQCKMCSEQCTMYNAMDSEWPRINRNTPDASRSDQRLLRIGRDTTKHNKATRLTEKREFTWPDWRDWLSDWYRNDLLMMIIALVIEEYASYGNAMKIPSSDVSLESNAKFLDLCLKVWCGVPFTVKSVACLVYNNINEYAHYVIQWNAI